MHNTEAGFTDGFADGCHRIGGMDGMTVSSVGLEYMLRSGLGGSRRRPHLQT